MSSLQKRCQSLFKINDAERECAKHATAQPAATLPHRIHDIQRWGKGQSMDLGPISPAKYNRGIARSLNEQTATRKSVAAHGKPGRYTNCARCLIGDLRRAQAHGPQTRKGSRCPFGCLRVMNTRRPPNQGPARKYASRQYRLGDGPASLQLSVRLEADAFIPP